jgi:hypothetical protein
VQLQGPQSLQIAMGLARAHERREQVVTQHMRISRPPLSHGLLAAPPPFLALPTPGTGSTSSPPSASQRPATATPDTVTVTGRIVRRLTPAEVDERRRNGQCFNCDEKYI